MPDPSQLPETMVPPVRRQAIQLSREYFRPGVQRLLETLNATASEEDLSSRIGIPKAQAFVKQATEFVQGMANPQTATTGQTPALASTGQTPAPAPAAGAVQLWHQTDSARSLATVPTLILFFPAGLIMVWTYSPWTTKTKKTVTWFVVAVLAFALLLSAVGAVH
jgi:hypothetical protein